MSTDLVCVGIDVAKAALEVAVHHPAEQWAVDYTDKVALPACMHQLLTLPNALLKHQRCWDPTYATTR